MKILRMTASFGKLDGQTLELTDGLNILTYPNEGGKSTWAAFLEAMLYGVETRPKRTKDYLPVKEKYLPWSGRPMEGRMDLEWNGRHITLQRTGTARSPMGKFRAWDTDTGEELSFLTGENCGETLLGVSRAVFSRSALIGQKAITVTGDASLEQRLQRLVTTGDETVSYLKTEAALRNWKNHVHHNQTGYLPDARGKLADVTSRLDQIHEILKEDLDRNRRAEELRQQEQRLRYILDCLRAAEAVQKSRQLLAVRQQADKAAEQAAELHRKVEGLPEPPELDRLESGRSEQRAARGLLARAARPQAPAAPQPPQGFDGLTPGRAQEQAERDVRTLQELQTPANPNVLWIPALLFLLGGAAAFLWNSLPLGAAGAGVGLVLGILWLILRSAGKKQARSRQAQVEQILASYGAHSPEQILAAADRYAEEQERFGRETENYDRRIRELDEENARLDGQEQEYLASVRKFASDIYDLEAADRAVAEAKTAWRAVTEADAEARAAGETLRHLEEALGNVAEHPAPPPEDFSNRYTLSEAERQLARTEEELHEIQRALDHSRGNVGALGDPAALAAEQDELEQQIRRLELREQALMLALQTLAEANDSLRSRFSPQITDAAGAYLHRLTRGKYETVQMTKDLDLSVQAQSDVISRDLAFLSGGTADQAYLALRLAICDQALEEGTPLVLDDALVFFDDDRLAAAMDVLREEAEKRQILLFTCQDRESKTQ